MHACSVLERMIPVFNLVNSPTKMPKLSHYSISSLLSDRCIKLTCSHSSVAITFIHLVTCSSLFPHPLLMLLVAVHKYVVFCCGVTVRLYSH